MKLKEYTKQVTCDSTDYQLDLLVKPDTDFNGIFKAWDIDCQEFIAVNGWLFNIIL